MSSGERRRGAPAASAASRSSASPRGDSIIAPPPRAQLGGSAAVSLSPSAEPESHPDSGSTGPPSGKDGGAGKDKDSAQVIKDKDEKIASLTRELEVMEAEFTRELERLSQNESETASFWEKKHSALNQQFLRTDTDLRLLRTELEAREAQRQELRESCEILQSELQERDKEILSLQGHLNGMKQWVSTSTRADHQTSDEEFCDALAKLGNGLQNWVIMHFRKAKLGKSADPPLHPLKTESTPRQNVYI
jgi:activating signal cointegrator complex subunit 1